MRLRAAVAAGKPKRVALRTWICKLLVVLNSMLRHPSRCEQGTPPSAQCLRQPLKSACQPEEAP